LAAACTLGLSLAAAAQGTVKVGVILPLSGAAGPQGRRASMSPTPST